MAPAGASFYTGAAFPTFRHNLFVAALRGEHLLRVWLDPSNAVEWREPNVCSKERSGAFATW